MKVTNQQRVTAYRNRFFRLFFNSSVALNDGAQRRTMRLLSIMLLTLIALFSIVDTARLLTTPGYQVPWFGYVAFGMAYFLSRTAWYQLAIGVAISIIPAIIFAVTLSNPVYGIERTVQYLVLSIVLASIFATWRAIVILAIINSSGLLLLPVLRPIAIPSYNQVITPLAVNIIGAALALIFMWHRNQIEHDRQAELEESEERYRAISELVSDFAFAFAFDAHGTGVLEWVTDAFTRITGYTLSDVATLDVWLSYIHPDDSAIALQHFERMIAGHPAVGEYRITARDGQMLWLRFYSQSVWDAAQGRVVRVYGAVQNMTRMKQLEQQIQQSQKMEAIGRMAGGIAHDFNNLLAVILFSTEALLDYIGEQPYRADVDTIYQAAHRGADLTRQLLAISRRQVLQPTRLDLNQVIVEMVQLLGTLIRSGTVLITKLDPDVRHIQADRSQLEQVIMNLVINARDALPNGGTITITTAPISADWGLLPAQANTTGQIAALLMVRDTGVGMDAATQARIFEPFFTTKPHGSGFGLATVHRIVTENKGQIWVDSQPGKGTIISVTLPYEDTDTTDQAEYRVSLPSSHGRSRGDSGIQTALGSP